MDAFTIRAGRQAADAVCLEPPGADEACVAGVDEGEPTSIGVGCHQQGVVTAEDEPAGREGQLYRCREAQGRASISAVLDVDEGYLPIPGGGDGAALASVVEIATGNIVAELPVGGEPEGVTLSPDGRWVYVTSENDSQVTVIDAVALEVVTVFDVGARPRSSNFSPDSTRAYVTAENGGTVSVVDTSTHTVTATVDE